MEVVLLPSIEITNSILLKWFLNKPTFNNIFPCTNLFVIFIDVISWERVHPCMYEYHGSIMTFVALPGPAAGPSPRNSTRPCSCLTAPSAAFCVPLCAHAGHLHHQASTKSNGDCNCCMGMTFAPRARSRCPQATSARQRCRSSVSRAKQR